ncbi:MAG: S-layer homology domain-containing protein [Gracilibacteraceae bacterium]|jgi:hypothetical protein|nr:S-layer homology domain-containing protein [Gracilibacteraceae bacterium]
MKNFKIIKVIVISFVLLISITGTAFADNGASKFTDIDNSWAKQHIINVFNKGLMSGYSETEFKPGDNVRNYDALVSISRMVNREKDINLEQLEEKYQAAVLDKFNVPSYARKAVALCLEKGIIKDSDVSAYSSNPYARKQEICRYLGLAFGVVVDSSMPPAALPFKDSMFIASQYKAYVSYLMEIGVISETTDNFNPNSYINRETYAKMLDIASDAYEKKELGEDITGGSGSPEIIWTDYPEPSSTGTDNNSDTETVTIFEDNEPADVTAYVDMVIPEYGNLAVFVGTERRVYKLAENVACTIDGVSEGFWKLEKSDMVRLYIDGNKVVRIVGESKIRKTIGKLVDIQSGDKTILTMRTQNGETRSYTITAKTIVIKDGKSALWQELKKDNDLVITTSYNELIEINADGVKSSDKGVIESLVFSRIAPPKLVITALDGSQNEYYADSGIEITGAGEDIYSLRPGMQVDVSLIDDEISKIAVINETAQVLTELKGLIKSIDLEAKLIIVEIYDSSTSKYADKKVYITDETKIANIYLEPLGLNSLKVNQIINVIGTGTVDGVSAKAIQVVN